MDATRTPTPLQARAEDTRQTILDSAVALYLSRGAENTTVSAIIRGARVGRTTFYRYFKDADDVLNQAVIRDYEVLMGEFETQRYEHPGLDEQLIEDMIWFIRQFRRRPALKLLFADNSRQLYERVDEALAGGLAGGAGLYAAELRARAAAGTVAGGDHPAQVRRVVHVHRDVLAHGEFPVRGQRVPPARDAQGLRRAVADRDGGRA